MPDYVICARNVVGRKFGSEPAPSTYLFVPEDEQPKPEQAQDSAKKWATKVLAEARRGATKAKPGNILVFVHGYNNSQATVMLRHRRLRDDLAAANFPGIVISFDWPSGDLGVLYAEDLVDAKRSSLQLVSDGIALLGSLQEADCKINVHILAHSMGAFVTRAAFEDADDRNSLAGMTWYVSNIMLIAGDISSRSLGASDHRTDGLYRNCSRLTCYNSRHDGVLAISNAKRAGIAPRVGRVGLPGDAPLKAVNVDCTEYWPTIPATQAVIGNPEHSWHIGDPVFTRDMMDTMLGIDREVMITRSQIDEKHFKLMRPA